MIVYLDRQVLAANQRMGWNIAMKPRAESTDESIEFTNTLVKNFKEISKNFDQIQELITSYRETRDASAETKINKKVQVIFSKVSDKISVCNKVLERLAKKNEEDQQNPNLKLTKAEIRMKTMRVNALQKKLLIFINMSSKLQFEMKTLVREKIAKQVRMHDQNISDAELEKILKNPREAEEFITNKLYGKPNPKFKAVLDDLKAKASEIDELEQNVTRVYEMFKELENLVKSQSLVLDTIEGNLKDIKEEINGTNNELTEGKQEFTSYMEKLCCISFVLTIVCIAGLYWLLGKLGLM